MTEIVSRKKTTKKEEVDEGRTLWQHLGIGNNGKGSDTFDRLKKMLKSMAVTVVIGYLLGFILDIYMETSHYAMVLAVTMLIVWILMVFGKDLKPPRKK